jgi:hypothetical protein
MKRRADIHRTFGAAFKTSVSRALVVIAIALAENACSSNEKELTKASDPSVIYLGTTTGAFSVSTLDGGVHAFGVAAATIAILPSPSGSLVAQDLAGGDLVVSPAAGGPALFTLRAPGRLLRWLDEDTLICFDESAGALRAISVDGATRRRLPFPADGSYVTYTSPLLSPNRKLVAVMGSGAKSSLLVLSTADGRLINDYGAIEGAPLAWSGNEEVVYGSADAAVSVRPGTPGDTRRILPLPAGLCALGSWFEPAFLVARVRTVILDYTKCEGSLRISTIYGSTTEISPTVAIPAPIAFSPTEAHVAFASEAGLQIVPASGGTAFIATSAAHGIVTSVGW